MRVEGQGLQPRMPGLMTSAKCHMFLEADLDQQATAKLLKEERQWASRVIPIFCLQFPFGQGVT